VEKGLSHDNLLKSDIEFSEAGAGGNDLQNGDPEGVCRPQVSATKHVLFEDEASTEKRCPCSMKMQQN
jgi:hypothetical protein